MWRKNYERVFERFLRVSARLCKFAVGSWRYDSNLSRKCHSLHNFYILGNFRCHFLMFFAVFWDSCVHKSVQINLQGIPPCDTNCQKVPKVVKIMYFVQMWVKFCTTLDCGKYPKSTQNVFFAKISRRNGKNQNTSNWPKSEISKMANFGIFSSKIDKFWSFLIIFGRFWVIFRAKNGNRAYCENTPRKNHTFAHFSSFLAFLVNFAQSRDLIWRQSRSWRSTPLKDPPKSPKMAKIDPQKV